jgi:transposase
MPHSNTVCAGIDVSKDWLDLAVHASPARLRVANTPGGHAELIAFCRRHAVTRVGLESTGQYSAAIAQAACEAGLEAVVHQPVEIKLFRRMRRQRAKTDGLDAAQIAAFTAQASPDTRQRLAPDPRLALLAERLLHIEQVEADIARWKTRRERYADKTILRRIERDIAAFEALRKRLTAALVATLKRHADLARRFELLVSIAGIGERSALLLVIRLPELGHLSRGEIAALVGVAPFDDQSGTTRKPARIAGGRADVRARLYTPVVAAATRWNPDLVTFYQRLKAAGKPSKLAFVAAMRKLLAIANAVLARGTPWTIQQHA